MVYVITGGPGFGKTSIIELLDKAGFRVCKEGARELIEQEMNQNNMTDFLSMPLDFERKIASHRIDFLQTAKQNTIAFSDRGLPDMIAYSWYKNKLPSAWIGDAVLNYRYAPMVFVTPPWEAIFTLDEIRKESFAEATEIHSQIIRAYLKYGYEFIDLPLTIPEQRMKFILNFLGI
ncbi:MAG: AAA family ATPase [Prolixibacteraceae bacterium]